MSIQDIQRTYVRTSLRVMRAPLTATEAVLRRGKDNSSWPPALAFQGFDGAVKRTAGRVLHDEQLQDEGRREQEQVQQLRKAAALEVAAQEQRATADQEYQRRQHEAQEQRERVERQAREHEQQLEREREQERQRVESATRQREQTARQMEAAVEKNVERERRSARRTGIEAERSALSAEQDAVEAKGTVSQLDAEIEASKTARRSSRS